MWKAAKPPLRKVNDILVSIAWSTRRSAGCTRCLHPWYPSSRPLEWGSPLHLFSSPFVPPFRTIEERYTRCRDKTILHPPLSCNWPYFEMIIIIIRSRNFSSPFFFRFLFDLLGFLFVFGGVDKTIGGWKWSYRVGMFPAIRRWMVVRSPRVEKDLLKVACCCWFGYSAWLRKFDGFCRISSGGWIFQALFVEYCNNIIIILGVINVKKFNFLFNCWE